MYTINILQVIIKLGGEKMKNKILIGLTYLFVLICTVGCANTKENTSVKNDNVKSDTEQTVKSKCSDVFR